MISRSSHLIGGLFACLALVTTGCGSTTSRPHAGAAGGSTRSFASSSSRSSPTVTATTPAHQIRTAVCSTSQLKIDMPWSGAAGPTVGGRIGFTNTGTSPCRLTGWPILTGITAQGKATIAVDKLDTGFGPSLKIAPIVTLNHGATAEVVFTGGVQPIPPATECPPPYRLLRVTPPENSHAVTIPAWISYYHHNLPSCTGIWVSEVVAYKDLYQN